MAECIFQIRHSVCTIERLLWNSLADVWLLLVFYYYLGKRVKIIVSSGAASVCNSPSLKTDN